MRIVVAVKQVPDTANVRMDENGSLVRASMPSILNPYCEHALAKAVSMKGEGDTVVAVTMGPSHASEVLRRCISLGADEAVLLSDKDFAGADTWATSRVLSSFIMREEPDADLYIFGRQAIDGDTGQVPFEVARLLEVQQFAYTEDLIRDVDGIVAVQDYGRFKRNTLVPKGSVVSFGNVEPNGHIPTMDGYLRGLDCSIRTMGRIDLGLGLYSVGLKGSTTRIVATENVTASRKNMKIEITDPNKAAELIVRESEMVR